MQAIYLRHANLPSLLVRSVTWSSWSHCGVIMPDNTVVQASARNGVIRSPLAELTAGASQYAIKAIPLPDDAAAYAFAEAQVGKPYDWWGVAGLALHREWDRGDAWWCSELIEACAQAGGRVRFVNNPRRITPQHSWMVA